MALGVEVGAQGEHTFEHVLALAIQDTRPGLQVLALEELGECDGCWVRRARSNRLRLPLSSSLLLLLMLVRVRVLMLMLVLVLLLLLVLQHVLPLGFHLLPLEHFYELGHSEALLCGISGELLLHRPDLFWCWLLPWLQRGRAAGTRHFLRVRGGCEAI